MHLIMGAVSLWTRPPACTYVHGPKKKRHQLINALMSCPSCPHNRDINHQANVLQPSRQEVQLWELKCLPTDLHLCSSSNCTATHALQIGLEVVVVVGAKNATAPDPVLEHANTLNNVFGTGCN